ncbi:hypothetical protein PR202_ga06794 [Eleusine coracana subsp. coracana]|uniref:CASP-like protein n=1 Tax=Eleusine coracana subsp. coracana TaxID=191504 RepID=A0AAV5BY98_ELECO|nr:hypothetical protein PR202_ga06794 [Eleusine coracana subsp. coracana]
MASTPFLLSSSNRARLYWVDSTSPTGSSSDGRAAVLSLSFLGLARCAVSLFVIFNPAPNFKMLGLLQDFAAGFFF